MKTLKILYKLISIALILNSIGANAQSDTSFILKSENFWKDPDNYFSKIDVSKIPTKILIDKVNFTNDIFDFNGISQVKTGCVGDFELCYKQFKNASFDTLFFKYSFAKLAEFHRSFTSYQKEVSIALVNIKFNQIKQQSFLNGVFFETEGYLNDHNATVNSYETKRFLAASVLDNRIHGDAVTFNLNRIFYISNINDEKVKQIVIDFGDGGGFRIVNWNEPITIHYGSECEYIEAILKLSTMKQDSTTSDYFTHFTFLRTGSSLVPDLSNNGGQKSTPSLDSKFQFYFPLGSHPDYWETIIHYYPCGGTTHLCTINSPITYCEHYDCSSHGGVSICYNGECMEQVATPIFRPSTGTTLQVSILLNPNNSTFNDVQPKLRKPFIVSDGFDPGNSCNWYVTSGSNSFDPFADSRGIYQILNGKPSPRSISSGYLDNVNLVDALQQLGYDIIVFDFIYGDGDIPSNAQEVKKCLNEIINGMWRDNETEEAVYVGPSMGGIISRITLTEMENDETAVHKSHLVGNWVSFDSPQTGANIPLGLQCAIRYLRRFSIDAEPGLVTLNSDAATQMLFTHYSGIPDDNNVLVDGILPHLNKIVLYNYLDQIGYPNKLTKTAISNGGNSRLFNTGELPSVDFHSALSIVQVHTFNALNTGAESILLEGTYSFGGDQFIKAKNQIGYDNAPGGFYPAPRKVNFVDANSSSALALCTKGSSRDIVTFMVMTSTFGVEVTQNNVYKVWDETDPNDVILTPFDIIHHMNENQEHVMITSDTRDYMINLFEIDKTNMQRPKLRTNSHETQNIYQPVSFKAFQTATFGSNDGQDKFIVNDGADVKITAGNSIIFKPGLKIEAGAKFHAYISNEANTTASKALNTVTNSSDFDFSQVNVYAEVMHDYSQHLSQSDISNNQISLNEINIYPNPAKDVLFVELPKACEGCNGEITAFDVIGRKIVSTNKSNVNNIYILNFNNALSGVYFIHVRIGNTIKIQKVTLIK